MRRFPSPKEIIKLKPDTLTVLNDLIDRYPVLSDVKNRISDAYFILENVYKTGNKLLVCGNGGSAADSEHIVGELMKKFRKNRPIDRVLYEKLSSFGDEGKRLQKVLEGSLRAISLTSHPSLTTAFSNDKDPLCAFSQQLYGLANNGDALLTISTSGNSENCVLAATLAKAMGLKTIALTGKSESKLSDLCDVTIKVPETETYKTQELHLPVYHALCAMLEEEFF